MRNKITDKI